MSAQYSTARTANEYRPTVIESRLLINRLALQLAFAKEECARDPRAFMMRTGRDLLPVLAFVLTVVIAMLVIKDSAAKRRANDLAAPEPGTETVLLNLTSLADPGGGSGPIRRASHGGGGSGDHDSAPPQHGKLPPPSPIVAAIPTAPPVHAPALPVAGIDIDPALWKDVKAPVYGDPRSTSDALSKGPGEGGAFGTNKGLGIGDGSGPGFGPGEDGNTGGGKKQIGCCGSEPGSGSDGRPLKGTEVDQRARLLSKPEPHYTEEARRNQISGTVMLRAIFASSGEVVQIQALNKLPFGLTEQAIAAARQIRFVPATKGGRAVSVWMNLEYNFNLY
jgi:TonB family protein